MEKTVKNILVVDDDSYILKVIVEILEKNTEHNIYQALSVDFAIRISNS